MRIFLFVLEHPFIEIGDVTILVVSGNGCSIAARGDNGYNTNNSEECQN